MVCDTRQPTQRRSRTPHFLRGGGSHPGAMTAKFELGQDFCTMHLPPKVHHSMFTHSEVIVLTNKQTNPQTNRRR